MYDLENLFFMKNVNNFRFISFGFEKWIYLFRAYCFMTRTKFIHTLATLMVFTHSIVGQINHPQAPQYTEFSPVNGGSPYYFHKQSENVITSHKGGMPDVNVMNNWDKLTQEEKNRISYQIHGYTPPATQKDIQAAQYQQIYNPQSFKQELSEYEKLSLELVNDAYMSEEPIRKNFKYYTTPEFQKKENSFKVAANNINQMLAGTKALSIKEAYYNLENAFGDTYLSYQEYNKAIKESADFIKKWLVQNGYDLNNNEHLHIGIQRFMKDTLSVTEKNPDSKTVGKTKKHIPFKYDYVDFKAETDHRNFFITKAMATGLGQCNSLPGIYLVLAEDLGAKSYLSFAPQHSFIKYPDNKGYIHNYEPTSNYKINDKWYEDHMHIGKQAKTTGIYLDTLNKKMIVASCLNDLAFAYMRKLGIADGKFTLDCINQGMNYFPKGNNIHSYFLKSEILSRMLERVMYENKIENVSNINSIPQGKELYQMLVENEQVIKKLGYQPIPEEMYLEMMDMHDERAKKQEKQNITGKQKTSLFYTY